MSKVINITDLEKQGDYYIYLGKKWKLNHPKRSTAKNKKMMVLATKRINGKIKAKLVHFGAKGYGHNYSKKAKENYLKRSSGIRNKNGKLTKDDKWSANFWSRKYLWPKNKPATGPLTTKKAA